MDRKNTSNKEVTLYIDWGSQPARTLVAFCLLANIPYQIVEVRLLRGDTRKPEYIKINPDKKIPAMSDGDFHLFESHAILRYLANTRDIPDYLYPQDPQQRARVEFYLDWHHNNTRMGGWLIFNQLFAPQLGLNVTIDLQQIQQTVDKAMKFINDTLVKDNSFIASKEKPTIADISCYCEIVQLQYLNYDYSVYPNLVNWMKRMESIPQIQKVHEQHRQLIEKGKQVYPKL